MAEFVWAPTSEYIEKANVTRLMRKLEIDDYWELVHRSQEDTEWFWAAVIEDLGIDFYRPYEQVLDTRKGPMWPRWFVGGRVNLVYNTVDRHAMRRGSSRAIIWEGEDGEVRTLNYAQLGAEVNRVANGLGALGIRLGDTVAIYMPMVPEAVIAAYAVAKIGAI